MTWAREQLHFVEKKKPLALDSERPWVPLKNLDDE